MKFYQGLYFPTNFVYLGYLGLPSSVILYFVGNPFFALLILLFSFALAFTKTGVHINSANKTTQEFTYFLGLKWGKAIPYKELKEILLKKEHFSQTLNARGSTTTIEFTLYNAYLVTNHHTILLTGHKNKNKVLAKMESAASHLMVPLKEV